MTATTWRAAGDQIRMQASSPVALLAGLIMPLVFAVILHSYRSAAVDPAFAVGIAGIGYLDALIVLVVVSLLGEKQWRTLTPALAAPYGIVPVVLGRLAGMTVQALVSLPGTLLPLALLWGLTPGFDWLRWLVGGAALALATTSVVGLMAFVVLRFPFSPGMTNGLVGLLLALGSLLVPRDALPPVIRQLSWLMPQSHVMGWVRGAGAGSLAVSFGLTAVSLAIVVGLVLRLQQAVRDHAIPLEA
ncbi:hypothetical protein ABZ434_22490 [Streptomyces sp. NPDC005761]|uniref:hypothetical protein n=1 Tax=unclassified Streptomyces TaxID=2593676 RepID=UPI0033DBDD73